MKAKHRQEARDSLYVLLWHDVLERLDTIILEARHLQISIIHSLREPVLYLPLRSEEYHLWGQGWEAEFETRKTHISFRDTVNRWMPAYPAVNEQDSSENVQEITEHIKKRMRAVWRGNDWNNDQRRHYHSLYGLQQFKQNVFQDKLFLCQQALEAGIHKNLDSDSKNSHMEKARFMLLRSGILAKARQHIERMRDFQTGFNKTLDRSGHDYPKPLAERRRELGIYMDFLSERCRDMLRDMNHLLGKEYIHTPEFSKTRIVIHRWTHSFSSKNSYIEGAPSQGENSREIPTNILFLNTNYWMPERPDLQPEIAHEVAHAVIRNRLNNFSTFNQSLNTDDFSVLLQMLKNTLMNYRSVGGIPEYRIDALIKEMGSDLLAASIKGISYVYALFLEIAGHRLDKLLKAVNDEIDLDMIKELDVTSRTIDREWYLRCRVIVAWVNAIHHHRERCTLDKILLDGCEEITQDLNDFVNQLLPQKDRNLGAVWESLGNRLCEVVNIDAPMAKNVQSWRKKRRDDDYKGPDESKKGKRCFPKSTARLDKDVRESLFWVQAGMKSEEGKPLHAWIKEVSGKAISDEEIRTEFENVYGVKHKPKGFSPLYRHLYDIPWQSAIMRAKDLFWEGDRSKQNWLENLHHDMALGRELFDYALEFFLWQTEPATTRLSNVIYLLDNAPNTLNNKLKKWLGSNVELDKGCKDKYFQIFKKSHNIHLTPYLKNNSKRDELLEQSAFKLSAWLRDISPEEPGLYRMAQRIAGLKIDKLQEHLELFCDNQKNQEFLPLLRYTQTRKKSETGDSKYKLAIESQTYQLNKEPDYKNHHPAQLRKIKTLMTGRVSVAGSYSTKKENTLALSEVLYKTESESNKFDHISSTQKEFKNVCLLGSYDILTMGETKPICNCVLPIFDKSMSGKAKTTDIKKEQFPTFFIRREYAREVDLHQSPSSSPSEGIQAAGFIVVALQRRSQRLDFLTRLVNSINKNPVKGKDQIELTGGHFEKTDRAFLTDGWGDILLAFETEGEIELEKIKSIFKLQNALFQDFMVDRTELILTPAALNVVGKEDSEDSSNPHSYQIQVKTRLMEDRSLKLSNSEFIKHIKKINKDCKKITSVAREPGRTDYIIEIKPRSIAKIADLLVEIAEHKSVDCIESSISRRDF